jgi:hypothetical protein
MKRLLMLFALALTAFTSMSVSAHTEIYSIDLTGSNESPANASPGIGSGTVTFDFDQITMNIDVSFSGLLGNVTASHIDCCTAVPEVGNVGVATQLPSFDGFPLGVTAGSYNHTFDLSLASSYNPTFITNNGGTVGSAMNALALGSADGKAYFNIHTTFFPGGEIRGFLQPVPIPAAFWLMGSAMIGLVNMGKKAEPTNCT